jgi:hypothetical protein
MLCNIPIFFIHHLGSRYESLSEREEKSGGCHLKNLMMTPLRKNQ